MAVFGQSLESKISELESITPHVSEGFGFGFEVERHDWRPIWALCKEIQEEFRGCKEFDSREAHQAAWERFQTARQEASRLADIEKEKLAGQSAQIKEGILDDAKTAYWSKSADFFVGAVLGQTTKDEMIELQQILKRAGRTLSENKHKMTREDKDDCFEAIQDARATHDDFWERYREYQEVKQQEHFEKQAEWERKTKARIEDNRDRVSRLVSAREKVQQNIDDNEDKVAEAWSDDFRERVQGWVDEGYQNLVEINEKIKRIQGWIAEDESKI
jgi:hypothetical protein